MPLSLLAAILLAIVAAPGVASAQFTAGDLAGTWSLNGLSVVHDNARGPGSWVHGTIVVSATGAIIGGAASNSDGSDSDQIVGGQFTISATGTIVGKVFVRQHDGRTNTVTIPNAQMLTSKQVIVGISTDGSTLDETNTTYVVLVKPGPPDFSPSDLDGAWRAFGVQTPAASGGGAGKMRGTLAVDAGVVTGTTDDGAGLTGTLTLASDGSVTGTISSESQSLDFAGVLAPDGTVVAGVATTGPSGGDPGEFELFVFQRVPTRSFLPADLVGPWKVDALNVRENGPDSVALGEGFGVWGAVTISPSLVISGALTSIDGTFRITGGTVGIAADGTVSGTLSVAVEHGTAQVTLAGSMFDARHAIVGTMSVVSPGDSGQLHTHSGLFTLVRPPTSTIQFSAAAYSVGEGSTAPITVTRSTTVGTQTVDYASVDGTATAGLDYAAVSGTLTFGPGDSTKTFSIPTIGDSAAEGNETVVLILSNPTNGAALGPRATAVLTIVDDEQAVAFSGAAYTVSEAQPAATITVVRTGPPTGIVTVQYQTSAGTAVPGSDYIDVGPTTLTFRAGQTSATFTVPIRNDVVVDGPRTVNLMLLNPTGVQIGSQSTAVLTITDDEQGGVIQFGSVTYSVVEGGRASVVVTRTGANLAGGVTVHYAVTGGTAVGGGVDYRLADGGLTFGANETTKTILIPTVDTTIVDGTRTIVLTLSEPTGGASLGPRTSTTVAITDNDQGGVIQFSSPLYSVAETAGTATIVVTRTGMNLAAGVTVDYAATGGSAINGVDYILANGTLTFGQGQTSRSIVVTINDDGAANGNRGVVVALSGPTGGASLGATRAALLTIVDDEQAVRFSSGTYTASEAQPTALITVTRSGTPAVIAATTVSVQATVSAGTAVPGRDYVQPALPITLNFAKGQTAATFTIALLNDTIVEGSRTVNLALGNASVLVGSPANATLTITDNDQGGVIQFASATYSVAEGGTATVTVTRMGTNLAGGVTVDYAVTGGTAVGGGQDYTLANGTLPFALGQTSKTILIPTVRNVLATGPKTIVLGLGNAQGGASLGVTRATTVTIADLDNGGVIKFASPTYSVLENGGPLPVTVLRTGTNLAGGVTVRLRSVNGSATAGSDYGAVDTTLTFGPGETSKTINVVILDDTLAEGDETFQLVLDSPTGGATLTTPSTATVTIKDNEATVQFSVASLLPVVEGTSITVTVVRTGGAGTVTVDCELVDDHGVVVLTRTLTFSATQFSATCTLLVPDDRVTAGDRTFTVRLRNPTGGAQIGPNGTLPLTVRDKQAGGSIVFTPPSTLPAATAGVPYSPFSFCQPDRTDVNQLCGSFVAPSSNPTGGHPPYRFDLAPGSFPPIGLFLNPNGLLTGTPNAATARSTPYTFTVCAVDLDGHQACKTVSIVVKPVDFAISITSAQCTSVVDYPGATPYNRMEITGISAGPVGTVTPGLDATQCSSWGVDLQGCRRRDGDPATTNWTYRHDYTSSGTYNLRLFAGYPYSGGGVTQNVTITCP